MKKFLTLFIGVVILFSPSISAKILDVNEVTSNVAEAYENGDAEIKEYVFKVNNETKQIEVYGDKELYLIINYGNDFISFDRENEKINLDDEKKIMIFQNVFYSFLFTIINMSTGEPYIDLDADFKETYDEYGLYIEKKQSIFNGEPNDYIIHGKISLDTDKITALEKKYRNVSYDTNNQGGKNYITPNIVIKSVTENSVSLIATYEKENTDYDRLEQYCDIYRSTTKDDENKYVKINDKAIYCNEEIIDKDLESNTKYYYKAIFASSGEEFGDIVEVITKKDEIGINNPQTGGKDIITIIIPLLISIGIIIYTKNRNVITRL